MDELMRVGALRSTDKAFVPFDFLADSLSGG